MVGGTLNQSLNIPSLNQRLAGITDRPTPVILVIDLRLTIKDYELLAA
jgi:hypothetical protein